jgi:predicted DNA-binding protein (MmcQ/YjbR family)
MKKNKNIIINPETGLPAADIHLNYPKIDNQFLLNSECIGSYKIEWDSYVYTLHNKIVSILSHNDKFNSDILNLKLRIEDNMELRDMYPGVIIPGYHMNKIHWSTVILNKMDELPLGMINELIDQSYFLVFSKLPKKTQLLIQNKEGKEK